MNNKGIVPIIIVAYIAGVLWTGFVVHAFWKTRHVVTVPVHEYQYDPWHSAHGER